MQYTRENPSPRYLELQKYYRDMHIHGEPERGRPPEQTFDGRSLNPHVSAITGLLRSHKSRSLTDYGCGKAMGYESVELVQPDGTKIKGLRELWSGIDITLYDPGNPKYDAYPSRATDAVICTDVMEHIPETDVPWLLGELFRLSRQFVFVSIACYPAAKLLPDGTNAHVTQKSPGWWLDLMQSISKQYDSRTYFSVIYESAKRQVVLSSVPVIR